MPVRSAEGGTSNCASPSPLPLCQSISVLPFIFLSNQGHVKGRNKPRCEGGSEKKMLACATAVSAVLAVAGRQQDGARRHAAPRCATLGQGGPQRYLCSRHNRCTPRRGAVRQCAAPRPAPRRGVRLEQSAWRPATGSGSGKRQSAVTSVRLTGRHGVPKNWQPAG